MSFAIFHLSLVRRQQPQKAAARAVREHVQQAVRTLAHIAEAYVEHGTWGIFVSRLLPVWRAVVPPFAGIARVPVGRFLLPLAVASAVYYGTLTYLVSTLGTNLEVVTRALARVNILLGILAAALFIVFGVWIVRRMKR